jgi:hypothetical protein
MMLPPGLYDEVLRHGKRTHATCVFALEFVKQHGLHVETATFTPDDCTEADGVRPQTIRGYYSRTADWMESIRKLGAPGGVQAVAVAAAGKAIRRRWGRCLNRGLTRGPRTQLEHPEGSAVRPFPRFTGTRRRWG